MFRQKLEFSDFKNLNVGKNFNFRPNTGILKQKMIAKAWNFGLKIGIFGFYTILANSWIFRPKIVMFVQKLEFPDFIKLNVRQKLAFLSKNWNFRAKLFGPKLEFSDFIKCWHFPPKI